MCQSIVTHGGLLYNLPHLSGFLEVSWNTLTTLQHLWNLSEFEHFALVGVFSVMELVRISWNFLENIYNSPPPLEFV